MDVTCDKCGAEYEFDETLLGDKGATVKCSSCNHVFRVLGRKEPGRPSLKLRFASSGRVESLSSLRDLQVRVRNGEVSADDLLGRDGFEFRRLGDVPELKNFFARPAGPTGTLRPDQAAARHAQVNETSMPPTSKDQSQAQAAAASANDRAVAKRTMVGVGPLNPHIPGPPRVPSIPGGLPAPSARPLAEPARGGPAPISSIPTNPNARSPAGGVPTVGALPAVVSNQPPQRAPVSQAPTTQGSVPQAAPAPMGGASPYAATKFASEAPPLARPIGNTPRTFESDAQGAKGAGVKLYLSDDEAPPARATQGNSRIWLYAGLAVLLGGAGWMGATMLNKSSGAVDPSPAAAPRVETPTPSPAVEQPPTTTAPVAAQPGSSATTPEAPTKAPGKVAASPTAVEPAAAPAPTEAPAPSEPAEAKDEKRRGHESRGGSSSASSASSGRDPTDYGGWVSRGDQLMSRGDLAGARQAYESALAMRGTGSEAHTGLGFALLAEGRARDAIPHFDRASSSGYAEASVGLGDSYRKLGQKSSAVEAYQAYLERLPTGSKANYARTQIETLKGSAAHEEAPAAPAGGSDYKPAGEMNPPSGEAPSGESTP